MNTSQSYRFKATLGQCWSILGLLGLIKTLKLKSLILFRFFLMYLINKDETEYTGQETYVWDMYKRRCWDFFPAGDCFRKQYESELEGGGGGG